MNASDVPNTVLREFGFEGATLTPITVGLVNRTYRVSLSDGRKRILQRLNPIFDAAVNADLDAITAHLASSELDTPRLVRTTTGGLCVSHEGVWRALTHLEGDVLETVTTPEIAFAAGELSGRFHRALAGFEHTFAFMRPGPHDTPRHMARLQASLVESSEREGLLAVTSLAHEILEHFASLPPLPTMRTMPTRIIHGDLKITNLMFVHGRARGLALLDLDTLQHGTYSVELGDALRSWCNPLGESAPDAYIDLDLAEHALEGWVDGAAGAMERDELRSIPLGIATIAIELASRFATDAIEDRFFGWDASRYASRTDHNIARATSQLALARDVTTRFGELDAVVERLASRVSGPGRKTPGRAVPRRNQRCRRPVRRRPQARS